MGVLRNMEVFEINYAISLSGSLDLSIDAMNPYITFFSLKQKKKDEKYELFHNHHSIRDSIPCPPPSQ